MEFNSSLVLIVLGVYRAFRLYLGFFFENRVSDLASFILGNRGIPWFVVSMTMLATLANAQQTLGIAGVSCALGLSPMVLPPGEHLHLSTPGQAWVALPAPELRRR